MRTTKTARRYASALLQFAKEKEQVEAILDDMNLIHNTLEGSRELVAFLRSPVIKFDDKKEALREIFGEKVNQATLLFLDLLARKGRIRLLDQVTAAFREQYNIHAGIIEVEVQAAFEMSGEQREKLHQSLEKKTGKKVKMDLSVNPDLMGGLSVRLDDTVIDGTVRHKLEELHEQLTAASVE